MHSHDYFRMDEFGSEELFNVLDEKPSDKKRPDSDSGEKKIITPEVLGMCNRKTL